MSQEELAAKIGYSSQSMISQIEGGTKKITLEKLLAAAQVLGVRASHILGEDEPPQIRPDTPEAAFLRAEAQRAFGARVAEARRLRNYISVEACAFSIMDPKAWEEMERGNYAPDAHDLSKIIFRLGVSADWLFMGTPSEQGAPSARRSAKGFGG